MNPIAEIDDTIPVLTDVIAVDDKDLLHDMPQSESAPVAPPTLVEQQPQPTSEQLLMQLEKTLHEDILRQLQTRIDFVLDHRIKDSLADVLQTTSDDMAKKLRQGLANTLEDIIQRAISQEISKLQSSNSK